MTSAPQLQERNGSDILTVRWDLHEPQGMVEHAITVTIEELREGSSVTAEAAVPQLHIGYLRTPHN